MPGLYMGPSSAFGGAFGRSPSAVGPVYGNGGKPIQSGAPPTPSVGPVYANGGQPIQSGVPSTPAVGPVYGNGGQPIQSNNPVSAAPAMATAPATPTAPPATPGNVLPAEAVRATGPSQGYDASYLQNLATAI